MDVAGSSLPDTMNPNNFPAKLWRLVNNPACEAIVWDREGTSIIIDKHLYERQILSAASITLDGDVFKSTSFQSFIRQLNLYGFKRNVPANNESKFQNSNYCYFFNPNFKRNRPELVVNLRRLTASIRAKMRAGLEVCHRPPSLYQRLNWSDFNDIDVKTGVFSPPSPPRQDSPPPHYSNKRQPMTPYNGTPVPPQHIKRRCGPHLSPSVFVSDNRMPVSLRPNYSQVFFSSNAEHLQQGLLAHAHHGNPNFLICTPPNAQHQPGHCSTAFKHYQPNFMASHLTASGLQAVQVSPHIYYQASYSVDIENQEVKKCDINMEAITQYVDEAMPPLPNRQEKPGPVLMPSFNTCNTMLRGNPALPVNANPLCPQPIIMAGSDNAYVVRHRQEEDFMLSVSEQMPDDAIIQCPVKDTVMMERSLRE